MTDTTTQRQTLQVKPHGVKRLKQGHPWVFSNELVMDAEAKAQDPGAIVELATTEGHPLGTAFINRHSLIAARLLSSMPGETIDRDFLICRLERARELREALFPQPHYRLVHAEADRLPGLIVDRYGDTFVMQANSAGMERLTPLLQEALEVVFSPRAVVLRNDSSARLAEGLSCMTSVTRGTLPGAVEVFENGATYLADLCEGQKTGWYFDQRENRAWASKLAAGRRVLDCYSFTGGFGIQAALAGADKVTFLDRSEPALALAQRAAEANGVAGRCRFNRADAFHRLEDLVKRKERFDLVICDPPAFAKVKKDLQRAARAYRKLARLAAGATQKEGFLVLCSCSHHMTPEHFLSLVSQGLRDAGREARLLRQGGAGPDHPLHPALSESGYLKALFLALD